VVAFFAVFSFDKDEGRGVYRCRFDVVLYLAHGALAS
jgi:hypothetical protein